MKQLLLSLLLCFSMAACNAQTPQTPTPVPAPKVTDSVVVDQSVNGDVLVNCVYKYDSKYNVSFLKKNKTVYHPPQFPNLTVYRIVDLNGGRWSINQYDWPNYTCTESVVTKD